MGNYIMSEIFRPGELIIYEEKYPSWYAGDTLTHTDCVKYHGEIVKYTRVFNKERKITTTRFLYTIKLNDGRIIETFNDKYGGTIRHDISEMREKKLNKILL